VVQFLQLDSHFIDFSSSCISKFDPNILSSSKKPIIWDGVRPLMLSPYGTCTKKPKENKYICLPKCFNIRQCNEAEKESANPCVLNKFQILLQITVDSSAFLTPNIAHHRKA
jgi:hypothetical protein